MYEYILLVDVVVVLINYPPGLLAVLLERGSAGSMGHTGRGGWIVWNRLYGATI